MFPFKMFHLSNPLNHTAQKILHLDEEKAESVVPPIHTTDAEDLEPVLNWYSCDD